MRDLALACLLLGLLSGGSDAPLVEQQRIELPHVEGRIDHLAFDAAGERLFIAALGNGTVEVVDVARGVVAGRIEKLSEPQGIVYLPETKQVAFTTGGDGKLHVHDATTLKEIRSFGVGGDADNVRVDAAAGLLYVGCEEGLAVVDVTKWEKVATISLAGHAESFQLDPSAGRCYVNVPDAHHIAVVDLKERKAVATWATGDAAKNYPMALDVGTHRLYVGCREPACLLVLDTTDGKRISKLPIGGDCDDVFIDEARARIYVTCGGGVVSSFSGEGAAAPAALADVTSSPGARTGLFVATAMKLFVIAPHRGEQRAQVIVFATH